MVTLRRIWRGSLVAAHISTGFVLLVATGAIWRPHSALVKRTKQWWLRRIPDLLGLQITVSGHLPADDAGPVLLVSNHVSWLDIPLIGGQVPTCFVAKAEVGSWPLIGTLAAKAGTLFIRRGSGDTGHVARLMADTLRQQRSILLFPEGTSTDGTTLRRLHTKLFKVCHHQPVQVQPVVIRYWTLTGENPVPFIDDHEFASHLWNLMGHSRLYASIEALPRFELTPETMQEQLALMEARMRQALHEAHGGYPAAPVSLCSLGATSA